MSTSKILAFLACAGAGVATTVWYSARTQAKATPVASPARESASAEPEPVELVLDGGREPTSARRAPEPEPSPPEASTKLVVIPAPVVEIPEDGSPESIVAMLSELQESRSAEAGSARLQELITKGEGVVSTFLEKERERRVEAGLYERIEGYVPGQPLTTSSSESPVSYSIEGGEARKISYPLEDYPQLHALRAELLSTRRALSRPAR